MASIDIQWKQLLWDCYHHGHTYKKDDSEVRELLGNYVYLERPQDIGLPFNRKINTSKEFLTNLKKGFYNVQGYMMKDDGLYDYVTSFEDDSQVYCSDKELLESLHIDTTPFVYTYPERLMHSLYNVNNGTISPDIEYINQIDFILSRLKNNEGSNRAVATLYHPGIDNNRTDIPCLNWLQATIRNNELELHCMFRSNDLYGAWPANMYLLTNLGLKIAEEIDNACFNGIHYHSSSLHIYKTDLPAVQKILR